jgi:hypothetical protein
MSVKSSEDNLIVGKIQDLLIKSELGDISAEAKIWPLALKVKDKEGEKYAPAKAFYISKVFANYDTARLDDAIDKYFELFKYKSKEYCEPLLYDGIKYVDSSLKSTLKYESISYSNILASKKYTQGDEKTLKEAKKIEMNLRSNLKDVFTLKVKDADEWIVDADLNASDE